LTAFLTTLFAAFFAGDLREAAFEAALRGVAFLVTLRVVRLVLRIAMLPPCALLHFAPLRAAGTDNTRGIHVG
jgi:hypothetical protein